MTAREVLERWHEVKAHLDEVEDWTADDLRPVIELARRAVALWESGTLSREELDGLRAFRVWLQANEMPGGLVRSVPSVISRYDVIRMMRDSNDSGADLWMALTNEFGIEDEELKRHFRYVLHEDTVAAAVRALRHLEAKPRGAIGREVRDDIANVLGAIVEGEAEVVE